MKTKQARNTRKNGAKPVGFSSLYAFGEKLSTDLSLSENPLGCSKLVNQQLSNGFMKLNDYPDIRLTGLKNALATKFGLRVGNFFIGNGSESVLMSLAGFLLKKGDTAIIPKLTFPMFSIASEIAGAKVVSSKMTKNLEFSLKDILEKITSKTKVIFLCNPNNPTGNVISSSKLIKFLRSVPKNIFVILDEANIEFGGKSLISRVRKLDNLIILRTFSKGYGLASLRIGFCVAPEEIISNLESRTQPFPISSISEKLAITALKDDDFLRETKDFIKTQREEMTKEIELIGFKVFPSQANNLFIRIPKTFDKKTFFNLLEESNVSVVRGSNFSGFDDNFFRLSPRDVDTNRLFLKKLLMIVNKMKSNTTN